MPMATEYRVEAPRCCSGTEWPIAGEPYATM